MIGALCQLHLSLWAVVEFDLFFLVTSFWRRVRLLRRGAGCGSVDGDDAALARVPLGVGGQRRWASWWGLAWRHGTAVKGPKIWLLLVRWRATKVLLLLLRGRSASKQQLL